MGAEEALNPSGGPRGMRLPSCARSTSGAGLWVLARDPRITREFPPVLGCRLRSLLDGGLDRCCREADLREAPPLLGAPQHLRPPFGLGCHVAVCPRKGVWGFLFSSQVGLADLVGKPTSLAANGPGPAGPSQTPCGTGSPGRRRALARTTPCTTFNVCCLWDPQLVSKLNSFQ